MPRADAAYLEEGVMTAVQVCEDSVLVLEPSEGSALRCDRGNSGHSTVRAREAA